jgi:hypothetical protein
MAATMTTGQVFPRVSAVRVACEWLRSTKRNANALTARPRIMKGIERSRIRRRPMRSMLWKARRVARKFVRAMVRDVSVGEGKDRRAKIVAEKYINEFLMFALVTIQFYGKRDVRSHKVVGSLATYTL